MNYTARLRKERPRSRVDQETVLAMIDSYIEDHNGIVYKTLKGITTGTIKGMELARESILLGTFYLTVGSQVSAWWMDTVLELGLGGSHYSVPFNARAWNELVSFAEDKEQFYAEFGLGWACFDGSILENQFELIVPRDPNPVSVKNMLVEHFFADVLGITPNCYVQTSVVGGKDIEKLSVFEKDHRGVIARKLMPYADDYLSTSRMKNLKLWWTYEISPSPLPKPIRESPRLLLCDATTTEPCCEFSLSKQTALKHKPSVSKKPTLMKRRFRPGRTKPFYIPVQQPPTRQQKPSSDDYFLPLEEFANKFPHLVLGGSPENYEWLHRINDKLSKDKDKK